MVLQGFHKGTIPKFTALQFMLGFGVLEALDNKLIHRRLKN